IYGYRRNTSPNIDHFAAKSVRFDRAVAQSSRSIRSVPAMFTGLYPSQIAYGHEYLYPSIAPQNRTLTESLRAHGYRTVVVMGTDYFARIGGFFQGFDNVRQSRYYKPPRNESIDETLQAIREPGNPWFVWVHLFNVHEVYLWDGKPSLFGKEWMDKY